MSVLLGCASTGEVREKERFRQVERARRGAASSPGALSAQAEVGELDATSGRGDFRAYAARHNPELKAAFHRWRASLEAIPQARALPNPKLSYSLYLRQVETRVGPQRHRVGVAQAFPWFGTLAARADVATERARGAHAAFEAKQQALFFEVDRWLFEYAYLARAVALTQENLELLRYLESVVRARYTTGAAQHTSVIQLQIEVARLEERLRSLADYRRPLSSRLSAVLNRQDPAPLPWPEAIERVTYNLDAKGLLDVLEANNPELHKLSAMARREEAKVGLATKGGWPGFALGVDYIETGSARMAGVEDSGKDPVMATLSLSLPIWRGSVEAAERQASAQQRAAVEERVAKRNTLGAELELALYRVRDAEHRTTLYSQSLTPKAKQAFSVALSAFASANGSFLDVIDAERSLLEFKLASERAIADRAIALADIERIIGRDLSSPVKTTPQGGVSGHDSGDAKAAATGSEDPPGPQAGPTENGD